MADTPNPEDLAKLYLEFWQQPLAGLTRDPQVAESIARMFDLMTAGAASFAKIVAGQAAGAENPSAPAKGASATASAKGAAEGRPDRGASSDARGDSPARLDQIARRVAELERRIARLEPRASAR
ncbi:MAG: hypothetical protein AAB223_03035, partial [Pseudomonadota bacterium]